MKRISLLWFILLVSLILFRNNILILFNNVYNFIFPKNDIKTAEIKILEEKINFLEKEYDELNNFKNKLPIYANYNYLVSRLITRENYFYNADILIEGGINNNIKVGMAVVNEDGLLGIVDKVMKDTSKIKLLQNVENLSVNINGYYGKLIYENGKFVVRDISRDALINLNDEVYTSTLGNIKEKLYVGKVNQVKNGVIEKEIIMESKVKFIDINYLLVVGDL